MNRKKLIKGSVDYKYYKSNVWLFFIIAMVLTSPILIMLFAMQDIRVIYIALVFWIFFLPPIIYHLARMIILLKKAEKFLYQEVLFDNPHSSSRTMYYTVIIIDENSNKIQADTKDIFTPSDMTLIMPNFEDYNNKKVLVAYDKSNSKVITIKVVEK